jgi:hypothetical protein
MWEVRRCPAFRRNVCWASSFRGASEPERVCGRRSPRRSTATASVDQLSTLRRSSRRRSGSANQIIPKTTATIVVVMIAVVAPNR